MRILALYAVWLAGAAMWFSWFWPWFSFWRRHRVMTYSLLAGHCAGVAAVVYGFRSELLAHRIDVPTWVTIIAWLWILVVGVFATVADRQLGLRVRSFAPYFDVEGRIELKTTGAFGVVRHPLYAAGIGFELGAFLATGRLAVLAAALVFTAGTLWFTREEERRLVQLLADPDEYEHYRRRVPALLPRVRP